MTVLRSQSSTLGPVFRFITATKLDELFTLFVLFVAVGSAWLTDFFGASYALGAFIAGIMLAESEYRLQIKAEIRPFRDILLGIFFISIGMLVNITTWGQTWMWILLLVIGFMLAKPGLIFILCKLGKDDTATAFRTALVLGQGGEFGFAILSLALSQKLIPFDWSQSALAALLISFVLSPILIRYNKSITQKIFRISSDI